MYMYHFTIGENSPSMDKVSGQKATPPSMTTFGLPHPLVAKQLVSLSGDKQLLIHSYLLEFSGSLGVLSSLPEAIEWSLSETVSVCVCACGLECACVWGGGMMRDM